MPRSIHSRLVSNLQQSSCLTVLTAGITGVCHTRFHNFLLNVGLTTAARPGSALTRVWILLTRFLSWLHHCVPNRELTSASDSPPSHPRPAGIGEKRSLIFCFSDLCGMHRHICPKRGRLTKSAWPARPLIKITAPDTKRDLF